MNYIQAVMVVNLTRLQHLKEVVPQADLHGEMVGYCDVNPVRNLQFKRTGRILNDKAMELQAV